jgi:hypothetical protein
MIKNHFQLTNCLVFALALLHNVNAQWIQTNGPYCEGIGALAMSGNNIFAGTIRDGVFLSTNSGTSWTAANTGLPANAQIHSLAVSGSNIFAGTWGAGVFLSQNNGNSWTSVNSGLPAKKEVI